MNLDIIHRDTARDQGEAGEEKSGRVRGIKAVSEFYSPAVEQNSRGG